MQKLGIGAGLLVIYLIISLIMFKWRFRVFTVVFSSDCQYLFIVPTLDCEVGVRPRIRVNYFSDYYGLTNLPDTTLIVTSRGLCTIKNSKNYVIFYTVNIDVLVILIMQANMNFTSVYGEVLQQCT